MERNHIFEVLYMKALKNFLPGFLVFLVLLFSRSFTSSASFQPPMLPSSGAETAVQTFTNYLLIRGADSLGVQFKAVDDWKNAYRIMTGQTFDNSFDWQYLSADSIDTILSSNNMNLYDSSGNIVPTTSATIALGSDGSSITHQSFIYDNSTGDILKIGESFSTAETSLQGGLTDSGLIVTADVVDPILSGESNKIYDPASLTQAQRDFVENSNFGGYMLSLDHNFLCYVPDGCSFDSVITPVNSQYTYSGYSTSQGALTGFNFFCTSEGRNSIIVRGASIGGANSGTITTTNDSYYGYSFGYTSGWRNRINPLFYGGWIYFKAPTRAQYNSMRSLGDFTDKVVTPFIVPGYDLPDTLTADRASSAVSRYYSVNNNYNNSNPTTINNYPFTITNSSVPNYSTNFDYSSGLDELINTPGLGTDIGLIPSTSLPTSLPILQNLQRRFPFSIPWDIYNLLSSLSADRTPPLLEYTLTIPVINYDWDISIDFSMYDDVAELFRLCFLILFIIALAIFSYNHFFGS